jgi:hypothetical protein
MRRRDGRTFRPEQLGGALRAELKQNTKQLMDEQFVHESERRWQDPSPFHWMAGSGSPRDFDIMRSCLPPEGARMTFCLSDSFASHWLSLPAPSSAPTGPYSRHWALPTRNTS